MDSEIRQYRTGAREVVLDLTDDCQDFVSGRGDGLLHVFVPHATAGIAIIETGAGSDDDLLAALADLLPGRRPLAARATAAAVTAARTCCRRSSRRTPPSRCSAAGWPSAPGRACAWST